MVAAPESYGTHADDGEVGAPARAYAPRRLRCMSGRGEGRGGPGACCPAPAHRCACALRPASRNLSDGAAGQAWSQYPPPVSPVTTANMSVKQGLRLFAAVQPHGGTAHAVSRAPAKAHRRAAGRGGWAGHGGLGWARVVTTLAVATAWVTRAWWAGSTGTGRRMGRI